MIEKILPDLYRIEVPLPHNPLKATNSYLIKGRDRDLIIDTGLNRSECKTALEEALRELSVRPGRTDLFITHVHADHLGLAAALGGDSSQIYFNRPEAALLDRGDFWSYLYEAARRNGFPEAILQRAIEAHPGHRYMLADKLSFTIVGEGDEIAAGDYRFTCVETPGHTWGHLCLYEPQKKIFISGDHILDDITPNISLWADDENPLADYLASLEKIKGYAIDLVLPGHRRLIKDCRRRIDELKRHHRVRADEVLAILAGGAQDAYTVASRMNWDIISDDWETFPLAQKWFATGEALAHLRYLEAEGKLKRETDAAGRVTFALN